MAQPPQDPSASVPHELMPHIHLVSSNRYPVVSRIDFNEIAKLLLNAPFIARDSAPFFWTFLDKPTDGSMLLTWQPLQRLGTTFASDGYVWSPPEQIYKHELGNGLILEVYWLKAGYGSGEQYTMHTRRRFRIVPVPGQQTPAQPDPSLFLVHYGPAEPNERVPISVIPYDERVDAMLHQRNMLMRSGQIRRKEFMLSDRANWPSLPELTRAQAGHAPHPRGVPQQMAYPSQATPGPPAKRARHAQSQGQQAAMHGGHPPEPVDDEEDTSKGDMFDHLTPRDISLSRYHLNHEWMEEILSSPYRLHQITPAELGLGFKGELAPLTQGIFNAQGFEGGQQGDQQVAKLSEKPYVGRLDPEKAEEFRKRVEQHVESTKADMEKMKAEHAATLAKFKQGSAIRAKERELKMVSEGAGPEIWRVDGPRGDDESASREVSKKTLDEIAQEYENESGLKVETRPPVKRVQEGGYQAPAPEPEPEPEPELEPEQVEPEAPVQSTEMSMSRQPSQAPSNASGIMIGENDIDMGNTAAGLLDQMGTGMSATSTPINFPTPQPQLSAAHSNAATPSNANVPSPAAAPAETSGQAAADVSMGGTDAAPAAKEASGTTPDRGTGSGDWVVVPKDGATPDPSAAAPSNTATESEPKPAEPAPAKPVSAAATPAVTDGGSAAFDQNDFSSLGDLDTAGDALAGYDGPGLDGSAGELGDGLDLNMEMDDSAFGDAFVNTGTAGDNA